MATNKTNLKAYWTYFKYVVRHKYYVYIAGRKFGVSRIQLLLHDWSKFLPCEFIPYAQYFNGDYDDINKEMIKYNFHLGWLHHIHLNRHHWNYWCFPFAGKDPSPVEMPKHFVRELCADWQGVGWALGKGNSHIIDWYNENKNKIVLHDRTREYLEQLLRDWEQKCK